MELLEQLTLIEIEQTTDKTVLTFLDRERGEIRDVIWNTKTYDRDTNKWNPSPEQEARCEEWAQEYFQVVYKELPNLQGLGITKDIYAYPTFCSLWESTQVKKFEKDMVHQIFSTTVKEMKEDNVGLHILFEYDGDTYQSNMTYSKYIEATKEWFLDPIKKAKVQAKFEDKFHIPYDNYEELVGKEIMVEVGLAFGTKPYAEIKAFPKKKKA